MLNRRRFLRSSLLGLTGARSGASLDRTLGATLPKMKITRVRFYESPISRPMVNQSLFSPTVVNEFSIGYRDLGERGHGGFLTPEGFGPILRSMHGMTTGQFHPEVNPLNIIPGAAFGGVPNAVNIAFDRRLPINAGDQRLDMVDNFSWIRGSHSLKFGLYYERNWPSEGPRATNFSGFFDFSRDPNNPLETNWAFSNALLGNFRSYVEPTLRVRG